MAEHHKKEENFRDVEPEQLIIVYLKGRLPQLFSHCVQLFDKYHRLVLITESGVATRSKSYQTLLLLIFNL